MINRTPELFEQIESYLNQQMAESEMDAFKSLMEMDEDLREEVDKHMSLKEALKDQDLIDFKQKLEKVKQALDQDKSASVFQEKKYSWFLKMAAVFVVVSASIIFLILRNGAVDETQLFADNFSMKKLESSVRGAKGLNDLIEVQQLYFDKEYEKAIPKLEAVIIKYPKKDIYKLYLASIYLNNKMPVRAASSLNQIKTSKYQEDKLWYSALSHLQARNITSAIKNLEQLSLLKGKYLTQSEELRKNLLKILDK